MPEAVGKELQVDPANGLIANEAKQRLQKYGPNKLAGKAKEPGIEGRSQSGSIRKDDEEHRACPPGWSGGRDRRRGAGTGGHSVDGGRQPRSCGRATFRHCYSRDRGSCPDWGKRRLTQKHGSEQVQYRPQFEPLDDLEGLLACLRFEQREKLDQLGIETGSIE
jgi:hypothetical protein